MFFCCKVVDSQIGLKKRTYKFIIINQSATILYLTILNTRLLITNSELFNRKKIAFVVVIKVWVLNNILGAEPFIVEKSDTANLAKT